MRFVVFLHVAAAVLVIGPLAAATMATPRVIRSGAQGVPVLRWLTRTTRVYSLLSLLVVALGAGAVGVGHGRHRPQFGQFWLTTAMTLYIVAVVLTLVVVHRDQRRALGELGRGESAAVRAGRIAAVAGATSIMWVVIVLLMVYRPGE